MKALRRWFAKLFSPLTQALAPLVGSLRSLGRGGFLRVFRPVGKFAAFLFWGVVSWCATLNLWLLLQGLPALIVGAGALMVLGFAAFTPAQDIEARYLATAHGAYNAKNFAEALTCYERLSHMQNNRPEVVYEWALTAQAAFRAGAADQKDRCMLLMNQLAPDNKEGYGKAHFWLASWLMERPQQTKQVQQLAETHFVRAIAGLDNNDAEAAHIALANLYLNKGSLDQAESQLQSVDKTKPGVRMILMELYARQGKIDSARREGKSAASLLSTMAKTNPSDHGARIGWAQTLAFLEEFPQAITILQEGLNNSGEQAYRVHLALVYQKWFIYLGRQGSAVTPQRLALLEMGLRYNPKNTFLLESLLKVTDTKRQYRASPALAASVVGLAGAASPSTLPTLLAASAQAEAVAARALLRRLLAEGMVTGHLHFAIGVDAMERGDAKEARYHLERALQLSPGLPSVANNLAVLLYRTSPNELNKALELANLAVEKDPNQMLFRDARGCILAKLGKYKEAAADLEAASAASPDNLVLHRMLADVYRRLELPQLAAEHERIASEKTGKKK